MDDLPVNLVVSVRDVNTILAALSKQPYGDVYVLVGKVKSQGDAVMNAIMTKAMAPTPEPPPAPPANDQGA